MRTTCIQALGPLLLGAALLLPISACVRRVAPEPAPKPRAVAPVATLPVGAPVVVVDALTGCEGDGYERKAVWERRGDWLVCGERRVPAGVADRLRELARDAPDAGTALPPEFGITAEAVETYTDDIIDAVAEWHPWLELFDAAWDDVTLERVREAALERLLDPDTDTMATLLRVTLPGVPPVTLTSRSELPYAQPWEVRRGEGAPRSVLSLEISRYVALLVDPDSPAAATLEGATYWRQRFWHDQQLWSDVFGEPWTKARARELCTEIDGWERVEDAWRVDDAAIGHINSQPLSLQPDLVARGDRLVSAVRWWNRLDEDLDPIHDWDVFLDVHARVGDAAARMPCLATWKAAGPDRVLSLDAVGDLGHNETLAATYHQPVWRHSGLAGSPDYVLLLRIGGTWVASLLLGPESEGAVVLQGHASLTPPFTAMFHPSQGTYAVLRPDGAVDVRELPAEDRE